MAEVVLYDMPSGGRPSCWSFNPWKARIVLNLKGIDYVTEWVENPDIQPTLKVLGIQPNETGKPFTIPVADIDEEYVMDSKKIARVLEARNPEPPMYMDDPVVPRVEAIEGKIVAAMAGIGPPRTAANILGPRAKEYFLQSREEQLGMNMDQWVELMGGELGWQKMRASFMEWADILKEKPGPFCLGETMSYADLVIVSYMQFCRRLSEEEVFQPILEYDEVFGTIYKACEHLLVRDD